MTAHRRADESVARQKACDGAAVLPLAGVVLMMPPVASGFAVEGAVLGVPVAVLYVFTVWAGLILGAFALSRRLVAEQPAPGSARREGSDV